VVDRAEAWTRQRRSLATLAAVSFAVLAFSGLLLTWTYSPVDGPELTRRVHLVAAVVTLFFALLLAVTLPAERFQRRRTMTLGRPSRRKVAIALAWLSLMLIGVVTAPLMNWSEIGLSTATGGAPEIRGVWDLLHDDVLYVVVGGFRVHPDEYQLLVLIHGGLPLLFVLPMLVVGVRRAVQLWQSRPEPGRPGPPSRRKQITSPSPPTQPLHPSPTPAPDSG
jgi:hypothetical protein